MSQLTEVVAVAVAVDEAIQRKSPDTVLTFFGKNDVWLYHAIADNRLCDACKELARKGKFVGTHLRAYFPYLEILNANTIKTNVHPNCRCLLHRIVRRESWIWRVLNNFDIDWRA